MTYEPSRAKAKAVARPIPCAAAVTRAVLPDNRIVYSPCGTAFSAAWLFCTRIDGGPYSFARSNWYVHSSDEQGFHPRQPLGNIPSGRYVNRYDANFTAQTPTRDHSAASPRCRRRTGDRSRSHGPDARRGGEAGRGQQGWIAAPFPQQARPAAGHGRGHVIAIHGAGGGTGPRRPRRARPERPRLCPHGRG